MSSTDWHRLSGTLMDSAGDYPSVQLQFLMQRLEAHPEVKPAIKSAIQDMGNWARENASTFECAQNSGKGDVV